MSFKTSARVIGFPLGGCLVWIALGVAFLSGVPYRGEHWALLYAVEHSSGLSEILSSISSFVCFGVVRFQPLAFYFSVLPYLIFKHWYVGQYLLTFLLHFLFTHLFLLYLHEWLRRTDVEGKGVWRTYPLEGLLFLFSLFAADLMSWSFYLYLQMACLLGFLGLFIALYRGGRLAWALTLIAVSVLLYEPMIFLFPLLLGRTKKTRENILVLSLFLLCALPIAYRYSIHLSTVKDLSVGSPPPILTWSVVEKAVAALIKGGVQTVLLLVHLIFPVPGTRGAIFEMSLPDLMRNHVLLVALSGWFLWVGFLFQSPSSRARRLVLLWPVLFLSIAWARTENSSYPILQYRYAYVLMIPLFLCVLHAVSRLRILWLRRLLLLVMISVQSYQSVSHWRSVSRAMEPISVSVIQRKATGLSSRQLTDEVNDWIIAGNTFPAELRPFLTNANSCSLQWRMWLSAS